jgi:hypothetical protein
MQIYFGVRDDDWRCVKCRLSDADSDHLDLFLTPSALGAGLLALRLLEAAGRAMTPT